MSIEPMRIQANRELPPGKGLVMNKGYILLPAPRPAGKARATSMPGCMLGASNEASGPAGRSPKGRGGGRASAALALLDHGTASPASRRLASARPALAPKCNLYSLSGPKPQLEDFGECPGFTLFIVSRF